MSHVVHHQVCTCVWVYAKKYAMKCILDISLSFFFLSISVFLVVWGVCNYYYYLFWLCWVFTSHGTQVQ